MYQDDGENDDDSTTKKQFFQNFMNDDDNGGKTKTFEFSQCFVNGEKVEGSQIQHDFENFMHCEFDGNDIATGNVNKKTVKRSYMEMELVQEPKPQSCCVIL